MADLTQEEIDALLNGATSEPAASDSASNEEASSVLSDDLLSSMEKDALGEIGNISMGSAATTLSVLLGHKVNITTPTVSVDTMSTIQNQYPMPYLVVEVGYVIGINGNNILAIQASDASIIADLMMGGDGLNPQEELTDIHMSAVGEAMNQMMGTVATSLSTMFNKKIDISPPKVNLIDLGAEDKITDLVNNDEPVVKTSFRMEVDGLIDSEIMQILPLDVAKEMVSFLMGGGAEAEAQEAPAPAPEPAPAPVAPEPAPVAAAPAPAAPAPQPAAPQYAAPPQQPQYTAPPMGAQPVYAPPAYANNVVSSGVPVQNAQFAPLTNEPVEVNAANISLIQDVPLQVTVELGRTKKSIREILEFSTGSIIELDKLAGEPVDIHVNGQLTAKGEVVVIDENFGVRITEIVSPMERVQSL
ncbi:flagellar motor switch phosphatase FliY [Anaerovibrio lipolyticus]|uniref:flagellar motor switch phosphatase FliY n=1 Tax=Anaerovibrio lipolyticus TaxID=82374 RepID=UPI001F34063E|nr:flagellar motor switch phosphatase FliY [Anaerovibrio lipolyticus]MCF2600363.1 flagellar motor switch phosphatase FliY [Anaerovibrio lipolyticus]